MLNYEISGSGKEHLVLLHGFMENLTIWEEMEKLTDIAEPELDSKVKANIEEYRTQLNK